MSPEKKLPNTERNRTSARKWKKTMKNKKRGGGIKKKKTRLSTKRLGLYGWISKKRPTNLLKVSSKHSKMSTKETNA